MGFMEKKVKDVNGKNEENDSRRHIIFPGKAVMTERAPKPEVVTVYFGEHTIEFDKYKPVEVKIV